MVFESTAVTRAYRHRTRGRRETRRADDMFCPTARRVRELSEESWGAGKRVSIVGRSSAMADVLRRIEKVAPYEEPILILGESGVGKESLAQAVYLLSDRRGQPFVSVNCPQYLEGNLTVSELFGHRKGSFTGATADRKGCFETADRGVLFLDEIGDLHMSAQVMLLRALASGEFQPLGSDRMKKVNVRVVAATNRSLNQLATEKQFRRDLIFRLRYFPVEVPPLRERGEDWRLLLDHFLVQLRRRYGVAKRFSERALELLRGYTWPGNVRQLIGVATTGYALAASDVIEPADFVDHLEHDRPEGSRVDPLVRSLCTHGGDFWRLVQQPYLDRDLNRREVQRLIFHGLRQCRGSYRQLLDLWGIEPEHYQKFMDFLRHHRLKPRSSEAEAADAP